MTAAATFDLSGRHALVTGAARGLGLAIAAGLARAGAQVWLSDVDEAGVHAAAAGLQAQGLAVQATRLDVCDEAAFEAFFSARAAAGAGIDILVNNAAVTPHCTLWDITEAEWDRVMAVNLKGVFFGCRVAARHLRTRGWGRIVNLSSMAGQHASSVTGVHYAASKAGVMAVTRSFAQELAPHGVTVNTLSPAAIQGPSLDELDAQARARFLAAMPVGRFGQEDEVAAAVVYLVSNAAGFVTGTTLDLNGGRLMR